MWSSLEGMRIAGGLMAAVGDETLHVVAAVWREL